MPFSQATIVQVYPPKYVAGNQVYLSWKSSSPSGTWFQIYVNGALSWHGQATYAYLHVPTDGVRHIDLGTVDSSAEVATDFSGSLPSAPQRRVKLQWTGGVFEGSDLVGFHVYQSTAAGGSIDYTKAVATIAAYPAGIVHDGYGNGGYGLFGYGNDGGTYAWTSDPLTSGTWSFGIRPYDEAGNEGTAVTTSQVIAVPPLPPALFSDGTRLHYTLASGRATLTWLASPG